MNLWEKILNYLERKKELEEQKKKKKYARIWRVKR